MSDRGTVESERRPAGGFSRFSTQFALAPVTLKLFAVLFVLAELVSVVASPNPLRGVGLILSVATALGIIAAIWVVWFGVGVVLLISIAVDVTSGQPWYEPAWALVALTLLCWPTSWIYIKSGGAADGSPSTEK